MTGVEMIAAERQRQIEEEGWTPEHDAQHVSGELAMAGAVYALYDTAVKVFHGKAFFELIANLWPWEAQWLKPRDRLRNLARAGALIAAEIDRIKNGGTDG